MSKLKKISLTLVFIICFVDLISSIFLFYNSREENKKLLYLKKEYINLQNSILEYEELKNSYTNMLEEEKTLSEKKTILEEKINNLNQEIVKTQNNIKNINFKIMNIS